MTRLGIGSSSGGRKIERSCQLCHRRKIRCDKKQPCASCARRGLQCHYPQAGQPIRRVRKTTIADVASRISDLEKTLVAGAASQQQQQQLPALRGSPSASTPGTAFGLGRNPNHSNPSASRPTTAPASGPYEKSVNDEILLRKGSSSQYFDDVLISRVIEESSESPATAELSPFNPMGILSAPDLKLDLAELLPPKYGAIELWRNYVDNIEICNKVLHRPTAEVLVYTAIDDPRNASLEALAVMFAIFFVSTVVLEPNSVQSFTGEDKVTSLHRFKTGLEQAFAKADFLEHPSVKFLEALSVYLAALRIHNPGRGLWTLNGLAIRAAQSIGLHRDGTKLGLSPFDSEIRRRIWWHLIARDGRAAEDYGFSNISSFNVQIGVSFPSNLEDGDLYPEMKELPHSRTGWTTLTLGLINIQVTRTWHRLAAMASSWAESPTPESVRAQVVQELHEYAEGFLRHCNPVIPQQRQTLLVARFIIRKVDMVTRQQWLNLQHPEARDSFATEENLLQALGILEDGMSLASDELLRQYRWSVRAYPQYHMLLYVLWHLCVKPEGPSVDRAWKAVDDSFMLLKCVNASFGPAAKMTVLETLRAKATAIRQSLGQQNGGSGGVVVVVGGRGTTNGSAEKESYPTPGGTDDRSEAEGMAESGLDSMAAADGMDWAGMMQDFPDWNTLMNEFQADGLDMPNYLN
ncbi:fungal-specific transcription factor [Colletotrichum phormii]|uniref:Fungal-specific transcription factor n=1 Tax=Colletotrichum phormii TaxID=359342 RepID=A0AAJ0E9R6_9PEZI|nr:fungal-specific transcription factor [Colletotrichum phormii]KAK1624284.1 fungal-specific transcription factor [Colletotrichum phormii]